MSTLERCPCGRPIRDCGPEGCTTIVKAGPAPQSSSASSSERHHAQRGVAAIAGTLKLAIATGRRELGERGRVSAEVWDLIDGLAGTLELELAELEPARRRAGAW